MSDYVELNVKVLKVTDMAVLVEDATQDVMEFWLPKSIIIEEESDCTLEEGEAGVLCIKRWFAEEEGLE